MALRDEFIRGWTARKGITGDALAVAALSGDAATTRQGQLMTLTTILSAIATFVAGLVQAVNQYLSQKQAAQEVNTDPPSVRLVPFSSAGWF